MAGDDLLFKELQEQRKVSSAQHTELRTAVTNMAKSVSDLTVVVARSEERHLRQDDGLRRMGKVLDDHEKRLRIAETSLLTQKSYSAGGWKVVSLVAAVVSCLIAAGVNLI